MQKEREYSKAKRLLAALMTAAMAAGMTAPLAYAADDAQSTQTAQAAAAARPVVVDQPTDTADTADSAPQMDTGLTYNDSYADTAPEGAEYAGTLDGLGMNVYRQEVTYADLGFSSAAEMDAAFAAANEAAMAESDAEHERMMTWLDSMLTEDDLAPMREEAGQVSEAAALLLGGEEEDRPAVVSEQSADFSVETAVQEATPETAMATPETAAATPETAAAEQSADGIALYAADAESETLEQRKAEAAAFLAEKGIDLSGPTAEDAKHYSISGMGDDVAVQNAEGGSSAEAEITVVDTDSVAVCVYDENNKPLKDAVVQFKWKVNGTPYQREAVTGDDGIALINGMGAGTCEDKTDLHRGYAMVSHDGYRTVEQFDADFNGGSRVNFKLSQDDHSMYTSAVDLDGVNLLDTKYTLNLSANESARTYYDLKVTMRNVDDTFKELGLLRLADGQEAKPTLDSVPAADFYLPNTDYSGPGKNGTYTAGFRETWGYRGNGETYRLGAGDSLYLYWYDQTDHKWHLYDDINLEVKQAANDAWWKSLSLNLSGTGNGTLTLPKGLGELNIDVLHFNLYAMLDLSGKLMIGYGRDWCTEKDKDAFESSAYKPSGRRWSQAAERMKDAIAETISNKNEIYDFTHPTRVTGSWNASFDIYGCIIAQWNPDTGYYSGDVVMSAGFEAGGSATFYLLIPIPPVGVPVYMGVEGSGSGRFTGDMGAQFKAGDFATFLNTLQVSNSAGATINVGLSAAVYAGIGLRNFVSAEANLACSLDMIFGFGTANTEGRHYPFHTQGIFDWGLTIKARFLFFTYQYKVPGEWPGQDHTLWDKWTPSDTSEAQALALQSAPAAQAETQTETQAYNVYATDMDAVSEGVYDETTGEASMTGQIALLAAAETNTNENKLKSDVLSGASVQMLTAKGGKNDGVSYVFRIASVTDSVTGKATPRLTIQNGGKCSSGLGETYVLPAPTDGADAGRQPYDYNFAVCDDADTYGGGAGDFTIAVTTGYLDDSHSLKERTRDLRVRVYRFSSETNTFTALNTMMPPENENYGYCGIPAVYGKGDDYFVAAPTLCNVNNDELLRGQIANAVVWTSNMLGVRSGEVKMENTRSFVRMLIRPDGPRAMNLYLEDSNKQSIWCYAIDGYNKIHKQNSSYYTTFDNHTITNFNYVNGCPGQKNWIMFTSGSKLWMPFTYDNAPMSFELTDTTGGAITVPDAENSLLVFSDQQSKQEGASYPQTEDSFHAIAIQTSGDTKVQSRIYSYDFTCKSMQQAETKDHVQMLCTNAVRNQLQVLQDRSVSSFTAAYHTNPNHAENKDLRLVYLADDTDTVVKQPDANGVGTVVSKCSLYNYELKKGKDVSITDFTIGNKTVDKKNGTFDIKFTIKNTGTGNIENATLQLKDKGGHILPLKLSNGSMSKDLTVGPVLGIMWPGLSMTFTAQAKIPDKWENGDMSLTLSVIEINGTPLSKLESDIQPYAVATYAAGNNDSDPAHSAASAVETPTVTMQVNERVYSGLRADGDDHYAEITFSSDNIRDIPNAELQIYGYTTSGDEVVKCGTYDLGTLRADGNLGISTDASYTVLIRLKDEWRHCDSKNDIWFLYFALCDKGADPYGLTGKEDTTHTTYDTKFLSNIEEFMTATVKTSTPDPFRGEIISNTDGVYFPNEEVFVEAEAKRGFTFDGWYIKGTNECVSQDLEYDFVAKDNTVYDLEARFNFDNNPDSTAYRVIVTPTDHPDDPVLGQVTATLAGDGAEARMEADGGYAYAMFKGNTIHLTAKPYDPDKYAFKEWRLVGANEYYTVLSTDADFTYAPSGSSYILAVFEEIPATCVKVYLDPVEGYGQNLGWQRTDANGRMTNLPAPKYDGHTFLGWFTAEEGGEQVTADTVLADKTTLYAHYAVNTDPTTPDNPVQPTDPSQPAAPGGDQGGANTGNTGSNGSNGSTGSKTAAANNAAGAQKAAAQAAVTIPRTADDFPLVPVVVLFALGACGLAVTVLRRKRSKK